MAAPEGYDLLARIGFVDRGNYSVSATYLAGDVVYYDGSSWTALKDNIKGVKPEAGLNWKYMARGFAAELLSDVTASDTSGLLGSAGESVEAQALIDVIADKVATKLIEQSKIVNNLLATDTSTVLSGPMGAELKKQIDTTNSNLASLSMRVEASPTAGSTIPANGFYAVSWEYQVPSGYKIASIEVTHTGSHLVLPFGVACSGATGRVIITVNLSNIATYNIEQIIPTCTVTLIKAL